MRFFHEKVNKKLEQVLLMDDKYKIQDYDSRLKTVRELSRKGDSECIAESYAFLFEQFDRYGPEGLPLELLLELGTACTEMEKVQLERAAANMDSEFRSLATIIDENTPESEKEDLMTGEEVLAEYSPDDVKLFLLALYQYREQCNSPAFYVEEYIDSFADETYFITETFCLPEEGISSDADLGMQYGIFKTATILQSKRMIAQKDFVRNIKEMDPADPKIYVYAQGSFFHPRHKDSLYGEIQENMHALTGGVDVSYDIVWYALEVGRDLVNESILDLEQSTLSFNGFFDSNIQDLAKTAQKGNFSLDTLIGVLKDEADKRNILY